MIIYIKYFLLQGTITQDSGCTNTLQTWHRPPKNAPKKSINEPVSVMLRKRRETTEVTWSGSNQRKSTSTTTNFLNLTMNSGLNLSIQVNRKANILGLANDHFYLQKSLFQTTVDNLNQIDGQAAILIEKDTRGQSTKPKWFEARRTRITASNIKTIFTAMQTSRKKNQDCSVMPARSNFEQKDLSKIPAIAWGKSKEREALEMFQATTSRQFRECGLFVDSNRNYLAASPDAICCCQKETVEIKCPYSIRHQNASEADCLNSCGELICTHRYYYQVQFQMHVTKSKKCHFVIYTTKGIHVTEVQYNEDFINSLLPTLDEFYKNVFCVEFCKTFGFK